MNRSTRTFMARRRMAGLSLIEMMVALVMALIVAAGIITVFQSTSSSNRVQAQLATLQEEGRFAIHSLRNDLANANGGYCSNTGGNASQSASGVALDQLNSPVVVSKDTDAIKAAFADNTTVLDATTQPFFLPSFLYMRGYGCTATACTPADPMDAGLPAMGKAVGDRVPGADVITVRYLVPGSGWAIMPAGSAEGATLTTLGTGSAAHISEVTLNPLPGEGDYADFGGSDLAMLADCSNAYVVSVSGQGSATLKLTNNYDAPIIRDNTKGAAPRVFDFNKDFQTVTYYLRVADAGDGHTTGELVRRVNGTDQALVRGVERLDFRYGIIDASGNTKFLTAKEVDEAAASECPPGVQAATDVGYTATHDGGLATAGCLWRAVQTLQVHVLMDGQVPLYTLAPKEMHYLYTPDGDNTPVAPEDHDIKPNADQGFPKQLLRREFTTLIALRNFNP